MNLSRRGWKRLLIVILTAWAAGWGSIYGYARILGDDAHKDAAAGIPVLEEAYVRNDASGTELMSAAIQRSFEPMPWNSDVRASSCCMLSRFTAKSCF